MTTATENAPSLSGNSAEGETETLGKGTIVNDATSVPQTIDTQISGGGITIDAGHLDYDVEQQCIVIDFPGGDVIILLHEALDLADALKLAVQEIQRRPREIRRSADVDDELRDRDV